MNSKTKVILYFASVLAFTCIGALGDEKPPRRLVNPEELFIVQEHGDLGFFGSELRSDRVYPLNWIARMHPEEKDETIYRISRTGGWIRDSFLIVPKASKEAFVIDWHYSRWNRELGPRAGKGMPEDIIASSYFHTPDATRLIQQILENKLLKAVDQIRPLDVGDTGDDHPFLLIERFGPGGYEGYLIAPELYHLEIRKEAETILKNLEELFVPTTTKRPKPEQDAAPQIRPRW